MRHFALALVLLFLAALAPATTASTHASGAGPTGLTRIDARMLHLASLRLGHASAPALLRWLQGQRSVRQVNIGRDGKTLDIRFSDGMRAAVLSDGLGEAVLRAPVPMPKVMSDMRQAAPAQSGTGRAVVLEPFASELGLGPTAGDVEVHDLQSAGFSVDQGYDTAVTVATMLTLSNYNVIFMFAHSGIGSGGDGVIATGELAGTDPSVAPYLADGSVIVVGVAGSNNQYYGITSRFVSEHMGSFPSHSIMFVNGCNLLSAPAFWSAASAKGLGVLVSWDNESKGPENYLAAGAFFAEMDTGMTVSGAITAELQAGYGTSTVNGQTATLGFIGNGAITLAAAAGGSPGPGPTSTAPPVTAPPTQTVAPTPTQPPPTSTPTTAPTVIPPTATPTSVPPTATPIPTPVPLSISLRAKVRSGTLQRIVARTLAGAHVRFLITFPNGDRHARTVTADAGGVASFSFVQPASTILRGHLHASVLVEAGSGATAATRTATYRIGWNAVDVSVRPRLARPHARIMIWVHSHVRTTVILSVGTGNRWLAHLRTRTGPRGWAHVSYRLPAAIRSRSLVVRADVHLRGAGYHTRTILTVS